MIVSFCFSKKLMQDESNMEKYQAIIFKSVSCAKLYHNVKFYTDVETIPYLEHIDIKKTIIDTSDFYFLDDFKIHLLSIIDENEILIDTDLFLFSKLNLKNDCDICVDFKDNCTKNYYPTYLKFFIENGIDEIIPSFQQPIIYVPNIGILKILNNELKKEYINLYYKVRNWLVLKNKNIDRMASIILGQYLLGLILENKKYTIDYAKLNNNRYLHFSGPGKFNMDLINNIGVVNQKKII